MDIDADFDTKLYEDFVSEIESANQRGRAALAQFQVAIGDRRKRFFISCQTLDLSFNLYGGAASNFDTPVLSCCVLHIFLVVWEWIGMPWLQGMLNFHLRF